MSALDENHTNGEWLQFLDDLDDVIAFLELKGMYGNAETVRTACDLLVNWNPNIVREN